MPSAATLPDEQNISNHQLLREASFSAGGEKV
jgi:hypothetical protein